MSGWRGYGRFGRRALAVCVASALIGIGGSRQCAAAVETCTRVSIVTSGPTPYTAQEHVDPPRLVLEFPSGILLGQLGERIEVRRGFVQEILCEYQEPLPAAGGVAAQPIRSITVLLSRPAPWRVWEEPGRIVVEIGAPAEGGAGASDIQLREAARTAAEEVERQQTMDSALDEPTAPRAPRAMPWPWVIGFAVVTLGLLAVGGWWLVRGPSRGVWDVTLDAPEARAVSIVGDFNHWDPHAHPLQRDARGRWSRRLRLESGWYEYRFLVDGEWWDDPASSQRVANPFGSTNNLREVR